MDLWYSESHTENVKFSIRINKHLFSAKSDFQRIDVFESFEFGRFLTLDGLMMLTEKDEFIYHEMISHVPMATGDNITDVLIIGAGDGGVVRELAKYASIKRMDLVEIDKMIVDVCKEFLPQTTCSMEDNRLNIHYQDGLRFIRKCQNEYDLIIVDSTNPFGVGEGLFTKEFYGSCYNALKDTGIMVNRHESPFYKGYANAMMRTHNKIIDSFPIAKIYQAHIPTYPSGHWLFGFASKKLHPIDDLHEENWNKLKIPTKYYNTKIHIGSFALPTYVWKLLENAETTS